jgi:hypothetical protein
MMAVVALFLDLCMTKAKALNKMIYRIDANLQKEVYLTFLDLGL